MTTYRPRATVEAIQWTGHNINEIWDAFTCAHIYGPTPEKNPDWLIVTTARGEARADIGDWIVRGITGLLMVCAAADFDARYEAVPATADDKPKREYRFPGDVMSAPHDVPQF